MNKMKLLEEVSTNFGVIAASLGAAIVTFFKFRKTVKSDVADAAVSDLKGEKAEATADVITILREEIARLSAANRDLQATVSQLQTEIQELKQQNLHLNEKYECMNHGDCPFKSTC